MVVGSKSSVADSLKSRLAFTMIELIFAIVVIGVTVLTVPLMIQTNNKALEGNAAQEAVFLTSSVLSVTTTLVWDNRSIVSVTGDSYVLAKILDISGGTSAYQRPDINSTQRVGGIDEDLHRQFYDYNGSLITPAQDDVVTLSATLDGSVADISGFKQAYSIVAKRWYVPDNGDLSTTQATATTKSNLKLTEVAIYSEEGDVIAKLRAYTANIGEVDFARRKF